MLLLGRLCGGLAYSILYSSFESWAVEQSRRMLPGGAASQARVLEQVFSDATTVASHDSASTSMTPPADSRLASKKAWHCVVRRRRTSSRAPREGIGAGGWLVDGGSP